MTAPSSAPAAGSRPSAASGPAAKPGRRRTVARRVLAGYAALLVVFAGALLWCFIELRASSREASLLRDAYVPLQLQLGQVLAEQNIFNAQLNHITSQTPPDVREWIETARRARPTKFRELRAAAEKIAGGDPAAEALRAEVLREITGVEVSQRADPELFTQLFQALTMSDTTLAGQLQNDLVKREADAAQRLRATRLRVDEEMARLGVTAQARERRSIQVLVALAALTLAVGVVMTLRISALLRPLAAVTARAEVVARGDLRPGAPIRDESEIGELSRTFERMVAAIAAARSEVVQAERLATIGKMAAHVTHEIRNPLSSIGLNLELLEEELRTSAEPTPTDATEAATQASTEPAGQAEQREALALLAAIRAETARLSRIAEQYLGIARRPAPTLELESIGGLVRELVAFLKAEHQRANVTVALDVDDEAPEIPVDEAQLRQALLNLIRNAREAMPEGGTLGIEVARAADGGVVLTIEDTGVGIPEEVRASVFDPFFTTKQRGTGLGLAVTREIVEAHGGHITCEARQPRGTRFRVALPGAGREPRERS